MKKITLAAGLCVALFLGSVVTAQAGTSYSFGFSFGVGPAYMYGYYAYPAYPYPAYAPYYYGGYYPSYPYYPYYPSYRTYVVPRYYGNAGHYYEAPRYGGRSNYSGNRWGHSEGKSNPRSKSGRWRY